MAGLELTASPGFLLLAAGLYYAGGGAVVTAFFTAALVHELGHLTALWLTGAEFLRMRVTFAGPVIDYRGDLTRRQEMAVVAAGPLAGLLFGVLAMNAGTNWFTYAGVIALLATVFNLLPVMPMDGGRLMGYLLEECVPEGTAAVILRIVGSACALGVFLTGLAVKIPLASVMGIWMAVLANMPKLR